MNAMSLTFPRDLISLLRCPEDGATLATAADCEWEGSGQRLRQGHLACTHCRAVYPVRDGVVELLGGTRMHEESVREQATRDAISTKLDPLLDDWATDDQRMEIEPTMEALKLDPRLTVLELGCGDGRYTVPLARNARRVLALDFSMGAIRVAQRRLESKANVGFVQADVSRFKVERRAFDRVFSTLTSNLPTPAHREALHRLAAESLAPQGRYVGSMHHHGLLEALRRQPKAGHYRNGIFREHFSVSDAAAQVKPHFREVHVQPVQIYLPLAGRLGISLVKQSRFAEHLPVANRLGKLVLSTASHDPLVATPVQVRRRAGWVSLALAMGAGMLALDWD